MRGTGGIEHDRQISEGLRKSGLDTHFQMRTKEFMRAQPSLPFLFCFQTDWRFSMLHAIIQNKTQCHRRYLGHRDDDGHRLTAEDEITSTVFGPLNFMEVEPVFRFWRSVFSYSGVIDISPAMSPDSCELRLWPIKRIEASERSWIQPDAHLTFYWKNGARIDILVEVKWQHSLSPDNVANQLRQQWTEYLDGEVRDYCWHVFIAPEISEGIAVSCGSDGRLWRGGKLILISWVQLRDVLSSLGEGKDGLSRWAKDTDGFLEKIGIRRFKGFAHCNLQQAMPEIVHHQFYSGLSHGFQGFEVAERSLPQLECHHQPFFLE
jgi:hypothetical protein